MVLFNVKIPFLATQQELRNAREKELASLKKNLEEEHAVHEAQIGELRHKYASELQAR